MGENHFCDCLTGCFALASWYHCYDNLSAVIDGVITSPSGMVFKKVAALPQTQPNGDEIAPHKYHQDDLFDPMRNQAVAKAAGYDGKADETEGTLDDQVEPFAGDVESTRDPLVDADPTPKPWGERELKIVRQLVNKRRPRFRRGRWK